MKKIVLATGNEHKAEEFRDLFAEVNLRCFLRRNMGVCLKLLKTETPSKQMLI